MRMFRLGDVCEVMDVDHKMPKDQQTGVPFISAKDLDIVSGISFAKCKFISEEDYLKQAKKCSPKKDDVLFSRIGTIGIACLVKDNLRFGISYSLCIIRPSERVFPEYLENLMNSPLISNQARKGTKSIAVPDLGLGQIRDFQVPLPPYETQKQIAEVLSKAKGTRQKREQAIVLANQLLQAVFVQMFGDPTKNERGFKLMRLGNICKINPKKSEIADLPNETTVSFIEMAAISNDGEILSRVVKSLGELRKGFTYFKEGDVLFAKITPCMENGKGAIATGLKNGIGFGSTEFHVLRTSSLCNSQWLFFLTKLSVFRKVAERNMTGTAGQKRVPKEFLENIEVPLPPIELQDRFASIMLKTQMCQEFQKKSAVSITELFDSLTSKAFKGELLQ